MENRRIVSRPISRVRRDLSLTEVVSCLDSVFFCASEAVVAMAVFPAAGSVDLSSVAAPDAGAGASASLTPMA